MHTTFFCNCASYISSKLKLLARFYGNAWDVGDAEWYLIKPSTRLLKQLKNHFLLFPQGLWSVRKKSDSRKLYNSSK